MSDALHFMTIAEAGARIAKKELSPVELIDAYISRIEALNAQLDAFITPSSNSRETKQRPRKQKLLAEHTKDRFTVCLSA